MKEHLKYIIPSIAAILAALILAFGMKNITSPNRTVSVRGLSEREVDADMAVWKLSFTLGADSLPVLKESITDQTYMVLNFLNEYGLSEEDYTVLAPEITDATVNLYMDSNRRSFDYIAKQSVLIRTGKVDQVRRASESTLELTGEGISVTSDYGEKVNYEFNGLNAIKPEMIADATQNARQAAEKFAKDSGSKIGKIQSASQGLFSIDDAATGLEYKKSVRVVTTVVYSLAD